MRRGLWSISVLLALIVLALLLYAKYDVGTSTAIQAQSDLLKGLTGYWSFEDTDIAGHVVYDHSGHAYNGRLSNGLHTGTGKIGQAMEFHGGSDYIDIDRDFIPRKALTISAWVFARSHGGLGNARILDNGSVVLKIPSSDRLAFASDRQGTEASSEPGSLHLNTWTHVVVVRANAGATNFYINGVLSGPADQKSGTPRAGVGHVSFGNAIPEDRTDVGWDGLIDEIRLYERVLSVEEIKLLYEMGR
jgi:hypothetical protein